MWYSELKVSKAIDWYVPTDFRCRVAEFTRYLDADATYDRQQRMGRMYWAWYKGKVVGYMMLAMGHVGKEGQSDLGIDTYGMIPALTIARLATDERHERHGVGNRMIQHAINIAYKLALDAGCRVVLANSEPDAVGFYEKTGFVRFTNRSLFYPDNPSRDPSARRGKSDGDRQLIPMYVDMRADNIPVDSGNAS